MCNAIIERTKEQIEAEQKAEQQYREQDLLIQRQEMIRRNIECLLNIHKAINNLESETVKTMRRKLKDMIDSITTK